MSPIVVAVSDPSPGPGGSTAGTLLVLGLIVVTIVILKFMSGSLRRMRSNVEQHPENFGQTEQDPDSPTE